MRKFVLCLVISLALAHSGYALKCYACDSQKNANCNDPFNADKIPLVECSVQPGATATTTASCMKMHTEDNHTGAGNITRKCVQSPKNTDACKTASSGFDLTHIKLHHCSTCETDECNSAFKQGAPGYVVFALAAATLAFFFKL